MNYCGKQSLDIMSEESGESRNQIHRYIRLTYLLPEILAMVDDSKIAFRPAVELSYLAEKEQRMDSGNIKAVTTYGTKRITAYHILEQTLNQRVVKVFDTVVEDGKERPVLNVKETAIAQDRQELIKSKFADWLWQDIDRRERLCRIYNDTFNSIRPREYDGSHLRFVGMNPEISLRKHQVNAIAHVLYGGNTLLAHEVGAGKSATRS